MKKIYLIIIGFCLTLSPIAAQTVLVNGTSVGGFELGPNFVTNGWTSANALLTNQWFVGNTPTGETGTRCAYISDNVLGTTHNYANTTSVSHFYRDVTVPATDNFLTITFNWKCLGQGSGNDNLEVFLVPTTTTPVAGTALVSGSLGVFRNAGTDPWQAATINACGVSGTMRLVFSWKNNNDGTQNQPPAAVDNIQVISNAISTNDLVCSPQPLILGVNSVGDNICAGSSGEPAAPGCWSGGTLNTVWFTFTAPASGSVKIKTVPNASGTPLQNTQIAVYSGTCGSLTFVNCNDNAPTCGGFAQINSELNLAGLTPGATYFIEVDGNNNSVGQFGIMVIDGTTNFALIPGQDCPLAFPLCNGTTTIGNPGYQVIGGQCDHNSVQTTNCTNGEANSVWYTINIGSAGNLNFDIVPNDFGSPNPITGQVNPGYFAPDDETDYDWVLWKVVGAGATSCAGILASGGDNEAECNWNNLGVTGCTVSGNAPAAYPGFNAAYEPSVAVVAGEQYVLVIQNFSNSTSGFTLQFPAVTPVTFTPSPIVFWSGGAGTTTWTTPANWGGCVAPTCAGPAFDAVVTSASSFQPILTPGVTSVRDLTINPGATLTLSGGANLQICGNFINNGALVCLPGSTITFVGTGAQNVTGSFTGANAFYHMVITKISGTVILNNTIHIDGNFTTSSATSILNTNGRYVKLSGHFSNSTGNTTYSNTGTAGTLEFSGAAVQNYNQGTTQLDLNNVIMNHTSAGVNLLSNMFIKATTGTLTLNAGKINTAGFIVDVANNTPACVTAGNATSYVNGNLYRTILPAGGAYEFPLGTTTLYERARFTFVVNTYNRLQTRFDTWPGLPNTQGGTECSATYSLPSENMGYWTLTQTGTNTGTYNASLFCTGATNTAAANGWTVEKATTPAGPWTLNGTCAASTAAIVNRNGMNGFSVFAAAQAPTPLPIELTSFEGHPEGKVNVLTWTTESEVNNSHFIVERSIDAVNFVFMERVEGSGNSNTTKNYGAVDEKPASTTYYRLKQFDYNGESMEYGPIVISNKDVDEFSVQNIYPNPAHQSFFIDVYSKNKVNADLEVYDTYGRSVYTRPLTIEGLNTLEIQSLEWSSGVYIVKITNEAMGFQYISRVIIE